VFIRTTAINKIRSLKKRKKIIQGGTSAGKTFGILPILIDMACKKPNLEVSVVSESIPHLKRGALKDFLKIMKATNRFIEKNYNKTDRIYRFENGSFIEFFSPESILGARRNVLYVNECNHVSWHDVHQLMIRTSDECFFDYNPSSEFWAQTELMKDDDVDFIILTYKDNEALSENIIKDIEKAKEKAKDSSYWANWWNVYGLGQMGTIEGIVFESFNPVNEFPNDCKWIAYGMDFGYTHDPTTLVKCGFKNGELFLEQLIFKTGLTNSDISNELKSLNIGRSDIIADSAEPKSIEELRRMGWNIRGAVKGKDSIINGLDLIKRYKVNIVNTSLDLIKEWRAYSYKYDKALNKYYNEPEDINNHAIDAVRYCTTFKMTKQPTAPTINVTRHR